MVTLKESVNIPASFEKLNAWADNFEEEFVKWSTLHWELIRDDMKLDNIYLSNILFKGEYPERIPAEDVKKYAPKDLMEKISK